MENLEDTGAAKPIINVENGPIETPNPIEKIIETKKYKLNLGNDTYELILETYSSEKINFKVQQINIASTYYYSKTYNYDEILQKLFLFKAHHENISKILKYIDTSISQNMLSLVKDNQNKKMKLSLNKSVDFEKIECILELEEQKIANEDIINSLINDIKILKSKENNNQNINQIINEMKEKLENNQKENEEMKRTIKLLIEEKNDQQLEMERKIKLIIQENNKLKEEFETFKKNYEAKLKQQENLILSNQSNQSNKINQNKTPIFKDINYNFGKDPNFLKFKELLTNLHSSAGMLSNFEIYNGKKDNVPYLVYNNKNNYNLEVMRLNDNTIVHYLSKHYHKVTVIKYYYNKNNDEEYLLSCDINKLVVIWDVQNNFYIKSTIQEQFNGITWDAHIIFNISNQTFILLSSDKRGVPIKLYELKENVSPFFKDIPGTGENSTNYMIPWFFNNKYYIIKFYDNISIHNIFENECYAVLNTDNSRYYCGFIYNILYLCANDRNQSILRIWDLANKNIFKEIKYDGRIGRQIIPWNDNNIIVACEHCFIIIDLKNGKMINKIMVEKSCLGGLKKVYLNRLGECLIISDFNNNIELFN